MRRFFSITVLEGLFSFSILLLLLRLRQQQLPIQCPAHVRQDYNTKNAIQQRNTIDNESECYL